MASTETFVPEGFEPPRELVGDGFRLEPLGPQHNASDLAAWTSSIEHVRATTGFEKSSWPPVEGMSSEDNLSDLVRHAQDFVERTGFTFTVLDPATDEVIGCVYVYPSKEPDHDAQVRSWVRADRAELDGPLADAVATWLAVAWPWERVDRHGR
jgi:hypothetical protein